ncbi:MAG TPA: 3'-5' exonuclease, partial [Oscillospiraceae bacterium]|nr:3'-5' exonuclease [Oscillospiraceae bacterium]
ANLRLLLEYAAAFERSGGGGISGFLRYIDRVMESSDDVSQANVISDTDNVVRIMSIHKSKGLEFPICFVCSCSSRFNLMDLNTELLLHYDKGVGVKINERRKLKKYTTLPYEAIRYAIQSNTISEEMRLLYVALTRAKEKLIITLSEANLDSKLKKLSALITDECKTSSYSALSARSFADWLLLCALSHSSGESLRARIEYSPKIIIDDNFLNVEIISEFNFSQKESELQITYDSKPDINDVKRIQQALSFSYEDQELTRLPAKLTVTELAKSDSRSIILRKPDFTAKDGLTGAQRGDATHKFMQYANYEAARDNPRSELERLRNKGFLTNEQAKAVNISLVADFFESSLGKRIFTADKVYREYKFMAQVPAREYDKTLTGIAASAQITIQGIADCIFVEKGSLVLLDYKTDYVDDEQELIDRYAKQLRIYREALTEIFNVPIKETYIYSFKLRKEISIE